MVKDLVEVYTKPKQCHRLSYPFQSWSARPYRVPFSRSLFHEPSATSKNLLQFSYTFQVLFYLFLSYLETVILQVIFFFYPLTKKPQHVFCIFPYPINILFPFPSTKCPCMPRTFFHMEGIRPTFHIQSFCFIFIIF